MHYPFRSMREDPTPHKPAHEKYYQGDNFLRLGGQEYQEFMQLQVHQAQAGDKGEPGVFYGSFVLFFQFFSSVVRVFFVGMNAIPFFFVACIEL